MSYVGEAFIKIAREQGMEMFERLDSYIHNGGSPLDLAPHFALAVSKALSERLNENPENAATIYSALEIELPMYLQELADHDARAAVIQNIRESIEMPEPKPKPKQ